MNETLATEWSVGQSDSLYTDERKLEENNWVIEFRKA